MQLAAFDTETHLIKPGRLIPKLVCGQFQIEKEAPSLHDARGAFAEFRSLFVEGYCIAGHNVSFDLAVMAEFGLANGDGGETLSLIFEGLREGVFSCTQIREQLLRIHDGTFHFDPHENLVPKFALAELVKRYTGQSIEHTKHGPDVWRTRYAELDGVPIDEWPDAARDYALADASHTASVWFAQSTPRTGKTGAVLVDEHGRVTNEGSQLRAAFALLLCGAYGIRTDAQAVDKFGKEIALHVAESNAIAKEAGFLRPNGSKDMTALRCRVDNAYFSTGRKPPLTPKGSTSTDGDTLKESGDPALEAFADVAIYTTMQSRYLEPARSAVHVPKNPGWYPLIETGRVSCREPNEMNPPRKGGYRECHVPRSGFLYCSVDYDMAEIKAMAQIHLWWFGESALADSLALGRDVHIDLGADLLGIPYEVAWAERKTPRVKNARQFAKIGNFGFMGGLGPKGFVEYARGYGIRIHETERTYTADGTEQFSGKEIRDMWLRKWPQMARYFERIKALTRFGDATIEHFISGRLRGGIGYTQCANGFFQGLVADGAKAALVNLTDACYDDRKSVLYNAVRPVLFLHDEIIAEVPEHSADECANEMTRIMVDSMQAYMPDVKVTASPALMRRWVKGADTVRDENGKLIPWEPNNA